MPFAIWCTTCKPHETIIGQGVRFNAEKKKVGNYYSTPVYSFRMKHTACGGWIEIRTDPKHTAYVVTEGARKRDTGDDDAQQPPAVAGLGEVALRLGGKQVDGEEDPLARLEGKFVDKKRAETESSRILELQKRQARDWDDPYEKSRRLRRTFRVERKGLERAEANREALKDKMSLGIDLVDETEEDRARAGFVEFGADRVHGESLDDAAARATRLRPLFASRASSGSSSASARKEDSKVKKHTRPKTRTADLLAERKAAFHHELTGNTRAAVDPFLNTTDEITWQPEIKRRRITTRPVTTGQKDGGDAGNETKTLEDGPVAESQLPMETPGNSPATAALVDYGSDSA